MGGTAERTVFLKIKRLYSIRHSRHQQQRGKEYEKIGIIGIKKLKKIFINLKKYLIEIEKDEYKIMFIDNEYKFKYYDKNYEQYINNTNYLKDSLNIYKRREELKNELKKYNLKLREDSYYCKRYINSNEEGLTLEFVVNKMREMNWFYTKTNYSKIYGRIRDNYINKKYKNSGLDDDDVYHYIKDRIYEKENDIINEEAEEEEKQEQIEISRLTKIEVLKNYKGNKPKYIDI